MRIAHDLELAAQAMGLKALNGKVYGLQGHHQARTEDDLLCDNDLYWNPHVDDGDALRLAVRLRMNLKFWDNSPPELRLSRACAIATIGHAWVANAAVPDENAAMRNSIVQAAAKLFLEQSNSLKPAKP